MRVVIKNEMPFTLHVAAVLVTHDHLRLLFSKQVMTISKGKIIGRMGVTVGETVETANEVDDDITLTCVQHGLSDDTNVIYQEGTDQDGREVRKFTLRPGPKDLN